MGLVGLTLWIGVPAAANALRGDAHLAQAPTAAYVVRQGDTLWAIASRSAPGSDPRQVVDRIDAMNGLHGGAIVPGQVLVVPDAG